MKSVTKNTRNRPGWCGAFHLNSVFCLHIFALKILNFFNALTKLMFWFLTSKSEELKNFPFCRSTKKSLPIFEISEKRRHNSAKTILSITTKKMTQQSQAIFSLQQRFFSPASLKVIFYNASNEVYTRKLVFLKNPSILKTPSLKPTKCSDDQMTL